MNQEHKDLILTHLKEQKELLKAQSETILSQSELIERLAEGLQLATVTTGEMSHKIQELQRPQVDYTKIKPVNGWIN
jgi:hypothetical protein